MKEPDSPQACRSGGLRLETSLSLSLSNLNLLSDFQDFEPVPYDEANYGKFHVGDSFIVLKTTESRGVFRWDVHFWLGSETTQVRGESDQPRVLTERGRMSLGAPPC